MANRALRWPIILMLVMTGLSAHAKRFRNSYISFELPSKWNCKLEGTEWVCTKKLSKKAKEAMIILTAKEVGPSDSIEQYMKHLKSPQRVPGKNAQPTSSKVLRVKKRKINNHVWVDGMHLGSEVESYYTRYLATIKKPVAVLVTFSAHKAHYTKYSKDFLRAIRSLKVVADEELLNNRNNSVQTRKGSKETVGTPIGPGPQGPGSLPPEESGSLSDMQSKLLGLALILIALGVYFFWMRKKKQKKKKRKRKKSRSKQ